MAVAILRALDAGVDALQKRFVGTDDVRTTTGNFAPVDKELGPVAARVVKGALPPGLRGTFARTGPNARWPPRGISHWFDGDGMVHAVHLDGERPPVYVNRWVRTLRWRREDEAGGPLYGNLGSYEGRLGVAKKILGDLLVAVGDPAFDGVGAQAMELAGANTALVLHGRARPRLLALREDGFPYQLSLDAEGGERAFGLQTAGPVDFDRKLRHPFTAHPKVDPVTGELMFFGYRRFKKPFAIYSVCDAEGKLLRSVDLGLDRAVMMHDMAITERFRPVVVKHNPLPVGEFSFFFNAPRFVPRAGLSRALSVFTCRCNISSHANPFTSCWSCVCADDPLCRFFSRTCAACSSTSR